MCVFCSVLSCPYFKNFKHTLKTAAKLRLYTDMLKHPRFVLKIWIAGLFPWGPLTFCLGVQKCARQECRGFRPLIIAISVWSLFVYIKSVGQLLIILFRQLFLDKPNLTFGNFSQDSDIFRRMCNKNIGNTLQKKKHLSEISTLCTILSNSHFCINVRQMYNPEASTTMLL